VPLREARGALGASSAEDDRLCRGAQPREGRACGVDAWRKTDALSMRVFSCPRSARLLHCRDTRLSHSCDRRSHGLPACLETRDWHIDCRDLHDAADLLRDDAVPAPSATCPAPKGYRTAYALPNPPLSGHTHPRASTHTTSPQPSTQSCYRLPTLEQPARRHTGAPSVTA
jgi:hypothetical protein